MRAIILNTVTTSVATRVRACWVGSITSNPIQVAGTDKTWFIEHALLQCVLDKTWFVPCFFFWYVVDYMRLLVFISNIAFLLFSVFVFLWENFTVVAFLCIGQEFVAVTLVSSVYRFLHSPCTCWNKCFSSHSFFLFIGTFFFEIFPYCLLLARK